MSPSSLRDPSPRTPTLRDGTQADGTSVSTISSPEKPSLDTFQTTSQDKPTTTQTISQIKVLTKTSHGQNILKTLPIDDANTTTKQFVQQLFECHGVKSRWKRAVLDWILMRESLVASMLVTKADPENCRDDGLVYIKYRTVDENLSRALRGDDDDDHPPGCASTYLRPYYTSTTSADPTTQPDTQTETPAEKATAPQPKKPPNLNPHAQIALMLDSKLSPSRMTVWLGTALLVSAGAGALGGAFVDAGGRDLGLAVGGLTMGVLGTVWGVVSSVVGSRRESD